MIKNIPISRLILHQKTHQLVHQVLTSGQLVQGPLVAKLEAKLKPLTGAPHVVAVSSGTAALHTALAILPLQPKAEVITTPFTFVATANAILMAGYTPVFADIDPDTFNLDPQAVAAAITPKTQAILAVNLFGLPAPYQELKALAQKHHLFLIEDAAQSLGAQYHHQPSGSLADIASFSLYATKNLAAGEGGFITTQNPDWAAAARRFRHHGQNPDQRYHYQHIGYNYRLSDLHAAIALGELTYFAANQRRRQRLAQNYQAALAHLPGIILPSTPPHCHHAYHQFSLRLTPAAPLTRDQLQSYLYQQEIHTAVYYPAPLYIAPHLTTFQKHPTPHTDQACQQVLSLPLYPSLTSAQQQSITLAINHCFKS